MSQTDPQKHPPPWPRESTMRQYSHCRHKRTFCVLKSLILYNLIPLLPCFWIVLFKESWHGHDLLWMVSKNKAPHWHIDDDDHCLLCSTCCFELKKLNKIRKGSLKSGQFIDLNLVIFFWWQLLYVADSRDGPVWTVFILFVVFRLLSQVLPGRLFFDWSTLAPTPGSLCVFHVCYICNSEQKVNSSSAIALSYYQQQ